jgi:hypothetical protein
MHTHHRAFHPTPLLTHALPPLPPHRVCTAIIVINQPSLQQRAI